MGSCGGSGHARRPFHIVTTPDLENALLVGRNAAVSAAEILRTEFAIDTGVCSADARDIKTKADQAAEAEILHRLKDTGIPVLSEEGGGQSLAEISGNRHWIIDPLDGTLNYTRGFPMACVSVGLWQGNRPEWGAIVDLREARLCEGRVGGSAVCGTEFLRVSAVDDASQAIIASGFPTGHAHEQTQLLRFVSQLQRFKKVRLLGSAALSLRFVAEGVFDAYCEEDIWIWDVAAGIALVLAAGGAVWMTPPNAQGKVTVFASNGLIEPTPEFNETYENLEKYSDA